MKTRTGNFPIGFIAGGLGRDAQDVIGWAKENELEVIDGIAPEQVKEAQAAGLRVGAISLPGTRNLLSADQAKRKDAFEGCAEYIRANAVIIRLG